MMQKRRAIGLLGAIVGFLGGVQVAWAQAPDAAREWLAFRSVYPYHVQTLAVSAPRADGSRVLVISEPPPGTSVQDIASVDSARLNDLRVYRHRIGYDGWVKDVVIRLPPMSHAHLGELLARTNLQLFGTTYGARVIDLDTLPRPVQRVPSADLTVRYDELRAWLIGPRPIRFYAGASTPLSVSRLLAAGQLGVFWSTDSALVAWTFPRTGVQSDALVDIRRFAVDTDILIGALADSGTIAVIGRSRRVPSHVLPPLRVETVTLLASVGSDELAQSYERQTLFAGRGADRKDWAPIYLSRILQDTEYGSLLNITDQLLKGWSQAGTVGYVNFDYPRPATYPFPKPLDQHLNTSRVTFNWNTKGVGYLVNEGRHTIYGAHRTGALPVSYFSGDEQQNAATIAAEGKAYPYFAELQDPNLVRVVQYAFLYQAFRALIVRPPGVESEASGEGAARVLEPMFWDLLTALRNADASKVTGEVQLLLRRVQRFVAGLEARHGKPGLQALANRMLVVRVNDNTDYGPSLDSAYYALRALVPWVIDERGTEAARRMFERSVVARDSWIGTPSLVESFSLLTTKELVGGHNVSASVTRFRASNGVRPGRPDVVREGQDLVIVAHPSDLPRLTGRIRKIATARTPEQYMQALAGPPPPPIPPRTMARALGDFPEPRPRGPHAETTQGRGMSVGFVPVRREARAARTATVRPNSATLKRLADGTFEYSDAAGEEVVRAYSATAATELMATRAAGVRPPPAARVELLGFSGDDANLFMTNVEWTLRQRSVTTQRSTLRSRAQRQPGVESVAEARPTLDVLHNDGLITRQRALRDYDWSRPKVEAIRQFPDAANPGRIGFEFEISAPLLPSARGGVVVRVTTWARGVAAELQRILDDLLPRSLRSAMDSNDPAAYLNTVLRNANAGFEDVEFEMFDMQVVFRPRIDDGSRTANLAE